MKPATHKIFGIAKRRGFWLRCFLQHEGCPPTLNEKAPLQVLRKHYTEPGLVSGHDFSRAERTSLKSRALAPEGVKR